MDDAAVFVDSDLSFALVLFRLPINGGLPWWGWGIRDNPTLANQSEESGPKMKIQKKGSEGQTCSVTANSYPTHPLLHPPTWFLPSALPSKRLPFFSCFIYYMRIVFAHNLF
jgi:hypothetical protein